jgi:hypothetical protein
MTRTLTMASVIMAYSVLVHKSIKSCNKLRTDLVAGMASLGLGSLLRGSGGGSSRSHCDEMCCADACDVYK